LLKTVSSALAATLRLVNADGTNLRDVPDLLDDDPSVAWSPDGAQVLVNNGWGSYASRDGR
jgi:hypothetical protein